MAASAARKLRPDVGTKAKAAKAATTGAPTGAATTAKAATTGAPTGAAKGARGAGALGRPSLAPARAAPDSPAAPAKAAKAAKGAVLSVASGAANMAAQPVAAEDQPIRPVVTPAMRQRAKEAADLRKFAEKTAPTKSMTDAAAVQKTKRGAVKKGTTLPPVLVAVGSSRDKAEWSRGPYGIFVDSHRFSCIRVSKTGSVVEYIPMTSKALDVYRSDVRRFDDRWKPYIYPLNNAATIYAEGAKCRGITEEARDHLETILGIKLGHLKLVSKEELQEMKKVEKAAKKAAKGEAPEAVTPAPEVTVTTVKNGEKTVVKTTKAPKPGKPDAKEPKAKVMSRDDAAKLIKAGGKLKKSRNNDGRKGTLRSAAIDAVQACADIAAALKASFKWKGAKQAVKFTDLRSAVRRGYVVVTKK